VFNAEMLLTSVFVYALFVESVTSVSALYLMPQQADDDSNKDKES